jgi:hypothetical protein
VVVKKPSYPLACKWIAENDDPEELDQIAILGQTSVLMVADLFGLSPDFVATSVQQWRKEAIAREKKAGRYL